MRLASELRSRQGRALLPQGAELTEKHIRTLKIWGIAAADIEGHGEEEDESARSLTPEEIEAIKPYAKAHFRFNNLGLPPVRNLARLYARRACRANASIPAFKTPGGDRSAPPPMPLDPVELAERNVELVSLPEVFHKILEAINDPLVSATHVAGLVSKDTNLSSRLLRVVNSPYYGFAERVSTLSRALALVGTEKLVQLVIGISAVEAYKDVSCEGFDPYVFWQHSVGCGLAASALAAELGREDEESFFVAGLLHDIGRLALIKLEPGAAEEVLRRVPGASITCAQMELRCWGVTHADLGGEMLRQWNLPEPLRIAVEDHHTPRDSGLGAEASVIHVADVVAHAMDRRLAPVRAVPPLDKGAWASLGLQESVLDRVVTQVDTQFAEIMKVFFHDQ